MNKQLDMFEEHVSPWGSLMSHSDRNADRPADDDDGLDGRFWEWISSDHGQEVYRQFVSAAHRLVARGWRHFGAKCICEEIRFFYAIKHGPDETGYKLNNNMVSRLARYAMEQNRELDGFFETRELKS